MDLGPVKHKTKNRFRKMDDFERSIYGKNIDYDIGHVTFSGYVYNLKTPQFNQVNRSQYGKCTDFKQDIVEYIGNNYYIPTSGNYFLKCNIFLTQKDHTEEFLNLI